MIIKIFQEIEKFKDLKVDESVFDASFVASYTDFNDKVKKNELSDEEIQEWDDKLMAEFAEYEIKEEDSPEVLQLKKDNLVLEARQKIPVAKNTGEVQQIIDHYKTLGIEEEIQPEIQARLKEINTAKTEKEKLAYLIVAAKEIKVVKYEDLPALKEKYINDTENPQLIQAIEKRIADEDPQKSKQQRADEIQNKLLSKKNWSYGELRELGIEPTDDDILAHGVLLQRQYMFKVYKPIQLNGHPI